MVKMHGTENISQLFHDVQKHCIVIHLVAKLLISMGHRLLGEKEKLKGANGLTV